MKIRLQNFAFLLSHLLEPRFEIRGLHEDTRRAVIGRNRYIATSWCARVGAGLDLGLQYANLLERSSGGNTDCIFMSSTCRESPFYTVLFYPWRTRDNVLYFMIII